MIDIVSEKILDYCEDHSTGEPDIYKKITELTYNKEEIPQMLSGNMVGNVLQLLLKLMNAKTVLELGTFTGYSALKMAEVIPDNGTVTTIDIAPSPIAEVGFAEAKWGFKINQLIGEALPILTKLKKNVDFIFVDADKRNYPNYYKTGKLVLRKGGLMVFDNSLWGGSVVDPKDEQTQAIDTMNKMANDDQEVFNQILPVRDGLMICQKLV